MRLEALLADVYGEAGGQWRGMVRTPTARWVPQPRAGEEGEEGGDDGDGGAVGRPRGAWRLRRVFYKSWPQLAFGVDGGCLGVCTHCPRVARLATVRGHEVGGADVEGAQALGG